MGEITVRWIDSEQTIAAFEFPREWNWTDFIAAQSVLGEMMDRRLNNAAVGIISVIPKAGKLPFGEMPSAIKALATRDQRVVKIVMVADNGFIRMMWQTVSCLFPDGAKLYGIADSIEAATTMITARFAELSSV